MKASNKLAKTKTFVGSIVVLSKLKFYRHENFTGREYFFEHLVIEGFSSFDPKISYSIGLPYSCNLFEYLLTTLRKVNKNNKKQNMFNCYLEY